MATAQRLKLGPLEHGRRLTLAEFDEAEYLPGFKYEIIDGRLYVSPAPNVPESYLEYWLYGELRRYADDHPDVLSYVTPKGRVFLPARVRATVPEPDIAAYAAFPHDLPLRQVRWQNLSPCLVAEVLVDGDFSKDMTRNPELYLRLPALREYWVLNGSVDPDEPTLIQHRRRGKAWVVTAFPFGSTFTTKLLPGFELVIDPKSHRR
jgi:Uma2 family endonuclease